MINNRLFCLYVLSPFSIRFFASMDSHCAMMEIKNRHMILRDSMGTDPVDCSCTCIVCCDTIKIGDVVTSKCACNYIMCSSCAFRMTEDGEMKCLFCREHKKTGFIAKEDSKQFENEVVKCHKCEWTGPYIEWKKHDFNCGSTLFIHLKMKLGYFKKLATLMGDGVIIIDKCNIIIEITDLFVNALQYEKDELIGKNFNYLLLHKDVVEKKIYSNPYGMTFVKKNTDVLQCVSHVINLDENGMLVVARISYS